MTPLYPTDIDITPFIPTYKELLYDGKVVTWFTVMERAGPEFWNMQFWSQKSVERHNSDMVRKRFGFYPERLVKKFVFHSLRHGFFITLVISNLELSRWDAEACMKCKLTERTP